MRSLLPLLLLVGGATLVSLGCSGSPEGRAGDASVDRRHPTYPLVAFHAQDEAHATPQDTWFDFQNRGPLEYLEFVVIEEAAAKEDAAARGWGSTVVFHEIHRGWIHRDDLPALIERVHDRRPALRWMLETCSMVPNLPQTVGEHAAAMILSYRSELSGSAYGGFPGSLSSDHQGKPQFAAEWARRHLAESAPAARDR